MSNAFKLMFGSEDKATFVENISAAIRERIQRLKMDSLSDGIGEFIVIAVFYQSVIYTGIQPFSAFGKAPPGLIPISVCCFTVHSENHKPINAVFTSKESVYLFQSSSEIIRAC